MITVCAAVAGLSGVAAPAVAADLMMNPTPAQQWTADPTHMVLWAGVHFEEDVWAGNIGGIWAFNGNLDTTGFLLRGQVLYVDYDWATTTTGSGQITRGNISLGYQWVNPTYVAQGFIGVDAQNHDVSPVLPTTPDDEIGLYLAGRLASTGPVMYPWSVDGDYSTANNTYWVRGRVGYQHNDWGLHLGPEVQALGDDNYNATRIGGYLSKWFGSFGVELSGGYQNGDGGTGSAGGDGGYGAVTLVVTY